MFSREGLDCLLATEYGDPMKEDENVPVACAILDGLPTENPWQNPNADAPARRIATNKSLHDILIDREVILAFGLFVEGTRCR
jgi:hypothetical protein